MEEQILTALGDQTLTIYEFHDLLGKRMSPMQKANVTKAMEVKGLIKVNLSRDKENGGFKSEVKRA